MNRVYDGLGTERFYTSTFLNIRVVEFEDGIRVELETSLGYDWIAAEGAKELKKALGQAIAAAEARQAQEEARRARNLNQPRLL